MKSKWTLIFLCFTYLACGDVKLQDDQSRLSGDLEDVTNLTTCRGATPAGTSLFNTHWRMEFVDKEDASLRYEQFLRFDSGSMYMTLVCRKDEKSASAQVQVAASFVGTEIHTLTQQSKDATFSVNGELIKCIAEIEAGVKMSFSFKGPCLNLNDGNSTQTMVPIFTIPRSIEPSSLD